MKEKNQIEYGERRVIEKKRRKSRKEGFRGDFGIEERKREIRKDVRRKKRRERESEYKVGAMWEIKLEKEREEELREEFIGRGCYIKREKRGYGSHNVDGGKEEDRFGEKTCSHERERERD